MKQIEVVAAIIRKDDKIFATQRGYGDFKDWWELPGGKMEAGEGRTKHKSETAKLAGNVLFWKYFCEKFSRSEKYDYLCNRLETKTVI